MIVWHTHTIITIAVNSIKSVNHVGVISLSERFVLFKFGFVEFSFIGMSTSLLTYIHIFLY